MEEFRVFRRSQSAGELHLHSRGHLARHGPNPPEPQQQADRVVTSCAPAMPKRAFDKLGIDPHNTTAQEFAPVVAQQAKASALFVKETGIQVE